MLRFLLALAIGNLAYGGLSYDNPSPLTLSGLSTSAAVAYTINPTTGSDLSCNPCASMAGALAFLPPQINHAVTLTLADGSYTVAGATWFGDLSRFSFGSSGAITLKSSSQFARAATTTTYALSAAGTQTATFASDPGFTANTYRGYFLRVATGAGAGSIAVVETHTTTAWVIAGTWSGTTPDNTSTVEILAGAATLTFSDSASTRIQLMGQSQKPGADTAGTFTTSPSVNLTINGVDMAATNNVIFDVNALRLYWVGRLSKAEIDINGGRLSAPLFFSDGGAVSSTGILIRGGSIRLSSDVVAGTTYTSGYIRNFTGNGISMFITADYPAGSPPSAVVFNFQADSNGTNGIRAAGPNVVLALASRVNGTGNGSFGVVAAQGAYVDVSAAGSYTSPIDITGTSGDIQLDGATTTWAEASGAAGQFVIGNKGSYVGLSGLQSVGPFTERLLKTTTGVNYNVGTKSTLYTVPSGKTAVITQVVVRAPSTNLTTAVCGFGRDASAADYSATSAMSALSAAGSYRIIQPTAGAVIAAAGDIFGTLCTVAQGSAATVTVDVFGFLF